MAIARFIRVGFDARTKIHMLHLVSPSYARHMALETMYDEMVDILDEIAEVWMGANDEVIDFSDADNDFDDESEDNPVEFLESYLEYVTDTRYKVSKNTEIQNIIDSLVALTERTLYKLRRLK